MATAAPAVKALNKLAQSLPLGEGEGSQGGPPVDQPQPNISPPPPANLAPVETPPPSMAPGLGTPGGAPADADSQAKPADKPAFSPLDFGAKPVEQPKEQSKPFSPLDAGAKPVDTGAKPFSPLDAGAKPVEQPKADQPKADQPQPDVSPPPPPPRAEAVQPSSPEQAKQDQIQLLMSQGKSAGEAQALANGQQPTTLTGQPPAGIQTDPETGTRFVTDPNGQKVPYAEPATAADKAANPPSGVVLPKVTTQGTATDQPSPEVRRAALVGETPKALPTAPVVRAAQVGQTPVALPTAPVVRAAQVGETPKAITVQPDGSDLPQRVQAVGDADPKAFIVHHTGGRLTLDGLMSTLKERGLGVEYFMDRNAVIHHVGDAGASNILPGWGKGAGLNNRNIVGMEISANDDADVTPAQKQAFAKFMAARYPTTPIFGHGEVNPGHKEANEGLSAKNAAMAYRESGGKAYGAPNVIDEINKAGINATRFGYASDPNLDPESKAGHGKWVHDMKPGYDVALNAASAAMVGNPKPGEEFEFAGRKWRYGDQVPEKYADARFDIFDPNGEFGDIGGGGGGAKGGGSVAKGGGRIKGMGTGTDTLVPMTQGEGAPYPSPQPQSAMGSSGGGSSSSGGGQAPEAPAGGSGIWFGKQSGGDSGGGDQSQPQASQRQQMTVQTDQPQQQDPMVQALIQRGFTPQQALNFAQSSQNVASAKGLPPISAQGQPSAPSAPAQLIGPAQSAPPKSSFKLLSPKQLMPGKVPSIVPKGPAPAAPGTPTAPAGGPDPSVIQGLIKRGFTREQATALVNKGATVSPGIGQTASFRPSPAAPPAPAKPTLNVNAQRTPPPAKPPNDQPKQPIARVEEPAEFGRPPGSTRGDPTPPGHEAIAKWPRLRQQAEQHASILSDDDPRVKKQADGFIKGEHFVEGDPFHETMRNKLPYGKGGRQDKILGQVQEAISDSAPMHISYISAPKEAEKFPTRDSRRTQYEKHSPEERLMGTTEGQLVGHSMIPVSMGVKLSKNATDPHESYVQGISTNVMANNFQHINDKLTTMGRKSPYEKLGAKFYNDLEGYFSNLNAGHTATGRGYAGGTDDHPNEPDRNHVPYKLNRKEADFIGAVINNTAAFAGHDDAKKLRELARANGTLITEKGETNRLLHDIEQADPGWSGRGSGKQGRVLEPSIKTFKTGLIHEIHPSEEHMPETIRPGKEYQGLTKAIARTSQQGRPDIPIAASLHHTFEDNRKINQIERDFSDHKIDEAQAREHLKGLGEDPDDYRFVGGSGGLITPYEDDPEALTPEEHDTMKSNLRQQWVGGKMNVEDYRKKSAEVPLPQKPSQPKAPKPAAAVTAEPVEAPPAPPPPKPSIPKPPKPPKPKAQPAPEPEEPETGLATSMPSIEQVKPQKPKPKPVTPPVEEPEDNAPAVAPAPDEPLPAKPAKAKKAAPVKAPVEETEEKLTKPAGASDKAWMKDPKNEAERQSYLEKRVANTLKDQNDHPSAIPLKVQRKEGGGVQHDPQLSPVWEKTDYDLANNDFLKKNGKALDQLEGADKHANTLGDDEHKHLKGVQRSRLSAMRNASAVHTMGDHILDSYNKIKDIPEIAAGKGWYSRMRDKMEKVFGKGEEGKASADHELFAQLLGATSAKTPVRDNFIQALDAFEQHKAGKFDRHVKLYKEAYNALQDGGYKALNQKMREQGILKDGDDEPPPKTDQDAMARWIDHHGIRPLKQNGAKYNSNSDQVLKVLAGTWLKEVGAPKTPNFAGNLTGRTLAATIDVWAARHLHRIGTEHDGEKTGWRPQAAAEPGVNDLDFAFSQDAMKHAADKIVNPDGTKGINPDDLQAILWYAEKQHYDQKGWTGKQGADKGSFDETWDKAFPTEGKAMTSKGLQEHYQNEKKRDDRLEAIQKTMAGKRTTGESSESIEKYMKRHVDPFLAKHGLDRSHAEAPAAPGGEEEAA